MSSQKFLILFNLYSSSSFLPCQILLEEIPTQEQEPDSPLNDHVGVEGDPVVVDTQTVDSPTQHATDGKEVICPFYFTTIIMN